MRSRLSQALLDNLATAWSRLDRARPRQQVEAPTLLFALDEWVRWAIRVDDELASALGAAYAARRVEDPGGGHLPGLRHVHDLTERLGHPLEALVIVSAGSPAVFYDVTWRLFEELPPADGDPGQAQAYRCHLAGRPARRPASEVTTFLLTAARDED